MATSWTLLLKSRPSVKKVKWCGPESTQIPIDLALLDPDQANDPNMKDKCSIQTYSAFLNLLRKDLGRSIPVIFDDKKII